MSMSSGFEIEKEQNGNNLLHQANRNKKDEFYTDLKVIEEEMAYYTNEFRNKTIICNCDDPYESNFFKYFILNFKRLQLKKLIATCYDGSYIAGNQLPLFDIPSLDTKEKRHSYKIEITNIPENEDGTYDISSVNFLLKNSSNSLSMLKGNGDFRSKECLKLLDEADICITNPPFSLFREFVETLEKHKKKYLIIGNTNALTYKEIFKLFKENKIRTGYTNFNTGMIFEVPMSYKNFLRIENGKKYARVSSSCWFTSLPVTKHKECLVMYKHYSPTLYPKYENYDAINVDLFKNIPVDYYGVMGVPVTFLDKYNPDQFEIIGLGITGSCEFSKMERMEILKNGLPTGKYTINAKGTLYRKHLPTDKKPAAFKNNNTGELYQSIFARVLIRRRTNDN